MEARPPKLSDADMHAAVKVGFVVELAPMSWMVLDEQPSNLGLEIL